MVDENELPVKEFGDSESAFKDAESDCVRVGGVETV